MINFLGLLCIVEQLEVMKDRSRSLMLIDVMSDSELPAFTHAKG